MKATPPDDIGGDARLLDILAHPKDYDWNAHGIGMLRTYLDPAERRWRINLWHAMFVNRGISKMHTHPWPFTSYVRAGSLENTRFDRPRLGPNPGAECNAMMFHEGTINCGPNFNGLGPVIRQVGLTKNRTERYGRGDAYRQDPEEIHDTHAANGTVTVMHRGEPGHMHEAKVYWPIREAWGDATRVANHAEVMEACRVARERLQAELQGA